MWLLERHRRPRHAPHAACWRHASTAPELLQRLASLAAESPDLDLSDLDCQMLGRQSQRRIPGIRQQAAARTRIPLHSTRARVGALSCATAPLVCPERPPDAAATYARDQVPETVSVFAVPVFKPRGASFSAGFQKGAGAGLSRAVESGVAHTKQVTQGERVLQASRPTTLGRRRRAGTLPPTL